MCTLIPVSILVISFRRNIFCHFNFQFIYLIPQLNSFSVLLKHFQVSCSQYIEHYWWFIQLLFLWLLWLWLYSVNKKAHVKLLSAKIPLPKPRPFFYGCSQFEFKGATCVVTVRNSIMTDCNLTNWNGGEPIVIKRSHNACYFAIASCQCQQCTGLVEIKEFIIYGVGRYGSKGHKAKIL